MSRVTDFVHNRWVGPGGAGALIVVSFALAHLGAPRAAADALMVAAAGVAGLPIVSSALRGLRARVVSIDLLVSVAAIGALVLGQYWEAAAVTALFALGGALEEATLRRTRSALAHLVAVAPQRAVVVRDGRRLDVPASQVRTDETVLVTRGDKVPVDGTVTDGSGAVDESTITGESLPAAKTTGDRVFAGTLATGGFLQVRATGVGADTTLARIIHRVEDAQDAKARTQRFMDRFSAWYTPAIVVASLLVAVTTRDVTLALTLLVIACPGALVISIPVAVVAGIGRGARDGILVKGGDSLETSARITTVALDKTGTLTRGRPELTGVVPLDRDWDQRRLLDVAVRVESGSGHPLARPLFEAAQRMGLDIADRLPSHVETIPGLGVAARLDGHRVTIGNGRLMDAEGIDSTPAGPAVEGFRTRGETAMTVAVDGRVVGVIAVADRVREGAEEMVARLHRSGISRVVMLTGDDERVAGAMGSRVGVDEVHAGLLPEDKLDLIAGLQREGEVVAMVGDGVNDAPALAGADIGVAMGAAGSAVAVETADIALMSDDLLALPRAIRLARSTVSVMRQNIAIALVTVAALLAGVLLGGVTMALGMLVHEASVLVVIVNALRLVRPRPQRGARHDPARPSGASAAPVQESLVTP